MTFTAQTLGELRNLPSTLDDTIRITDAMGRPVKLHLDYSKGEGGVLIASHLSTDYGQMKAKVEDALTILRDPFNQPGWALERQLLKLVNRLIEVLA